MNDETLTYLPVSAIRKPRISLRPIRRNTPEYVELVESIRKDGVLQPLLVRPWDDEHEVVEGWHRLTAANEAGLLEVPCLIRVMTDDEVLIVQVKCNAIRPKTFSFEYARRLKILMEKGLTLLELSAIVDKAPKWIRDQIHLNRLCEQARPSVECGDIEMGAALALANLPEELQTKFLADAIEMKQSEFMPRAKGALRDYKTFLLKEQKEDREAGAANPTLRNINMMKREATSPTHAKKVLRRVKATTPLDGWEACMAWIFRLDPLSVERRRTKEKEPEAKAIQATQAEYRKLNRDMIRKFVNPQSETGDYRNGK